MASVRRWFKDKALGLWDALIDTLSGLTARGWGILALSVGGFLLLYYPVGMAFYHTIDDDLSYRISDADRAAGGSVAVATVTALILREVDDNGWVANDPFFKPSAALDNMPNFQRGMFSAFARFSVELFDQLGRTRGSSASDPDLDKAKSSLQMKGELWYIDTATSLLPVAPAESHYREAAARLQAYNARVASGEAIFDKRADNLLATFDRIALDLGAASAVLGQQIDNHAASWFDRTADDRFYFIKGQAYGFYMILTGLRADFSEVITARGLDQPMAQLMQSLAALVALDPVVVVNADPDGMIFANHLAAQGFYLLRARTQLREITNILLK